PTRSTSHAWTCYCRPMADEFDESPQRAAILERRRRLIERGLAESGVPTTRPSTRRIGALALSLSGLATACPCLSIARPDTEESEDDGVTETDGMTGTDGATETEDAT